MYQYRCGRCGLTSPAFMTRAAAEGERHSHRVNFHGGYIPDGGRIVSPEPFRASDIPLRQWMLGGGMTLVVVIGILTRAL